LGEISPYFLGETSRTIGECFRNTKAPTVNQMSYLFGLFDQRRLMESDLVTFTEKDDHGIGSDDGPAEAPKSLFEEAQVGKDHQ
jgi:hypothetical protein